MNELKYQLVLQFRCDDIADYDTLVNFEAQLSSTIRDSSEVDGHDFGSGEFNIFLLTDDPIKTFADCQIQRRSELSKYDPVAAYREVLGEDYTVLWPPTQTGFHLA